MNQPVMEQPRKGSMLEALILSLMLILANLRATMFVYLHPDVSRLLGPAWIEIFVWCIVFAGIIRILKRNELLPEYLARWRSNWLVGILIVIVVGSVFWSIEPDISAFRALEFLLATLAGAYVGVRYGLREFGQILFWFGAVLLIITFAIVYAAPQTGVMDWAPFYGAWRGLFWHRNHLASITALINAVFLVGAVTGFEQHRQTKWLEAIFYVISWMVLIFARSATGFIVVIVVHGCVLCAWLWIKFAHRLQRSNYYVLGGAFLAGSVVLLSNLDIVFGLFNRNSTLTGRTGLWMYLLTEIVPQRLWWGYGFGAVWNMDSFRELVRQHIGWASQPLIADNGFLEIGLHLGVAGLLIFLAVLGTVVVRAAVYAFSRKTLMDFIPLIIMVYAVFANISFSMFAETEVFVWMLLVAALFMVTPRRAG